MRWGTLIAVGLVAVVLLTSTGCDPGCGDKTAQARFDLDRIERASLQFERDFGRAPVSQRELATPPGDRAPYLDELPRDPWTGEAYRERIESGRLILFSLGSDGEPGGVSHALDLSTAEIGR